MTATAYYCPSCKRRIWRDYGCSRNKMPRHLDSVCERTGQFVTIRKSRNQKRTEGGSDA